MKILFRWHRGSLSESMKTVKEFTSYKELFEYIKEDLSPWGIALKELTFDYCGFDERTKWDTWYVCHDGHCIGMTNCNPLKN